MPFGANAAPTLCQRGANVVQICISKPTRRVLARRLCATRYRKFFLPVKHATCKNILLKLIGTKSRPTAPRARVDGCAAAAAAGRPPYLFRLCAQRSKSKKTEHPNSSISYSKPFQNKKKIKLRKLLIFYFPAGAVCQKKIFSLRGTFNSNFRCRGPQRPRNTKSAEKPGFAQNHSVKTFK